MTSTLYTLIRRNRIAAQDIALAIGIILLTGFVAYEATLTGSIPSEKRLEFEEMLAVGALIVATLLYLGWRRVRDQEREIGRRMAAERRAHELAHTDVLTGLPNRRAFENTLTAALNTPLGPNEVHAVLLLDLNGFKKINDLHGHAEGDDLLVVLAERLTAATRDRDVVCRIGGDEFAMIAHHLAGAEGATSIALRIQKEMEPPFRIGSHQHHIGAGIGIALYPRDGRTPEEIVRKADIALYRAKAEPETGMRFFEEEMDLHLREHDFIECELGAAIGTDALRPWYQPIVELKTGEVIGFEALVRWAHPKLGQVPPDRFIPIAEDSGLIHRLGEWLLRCAATDALNWPSNATLSFNISAVQLKDSTLGLRILNILADTGLAPHRLEIEITESAVVRDLDTAQGVLSALRDAGVRIALDDFGTGYSSLYHLRRFKMDKIKIDQSFIHSMTTEKESATIVQALSGLGLGLGLTITAEGVEDSAERDALISLGCQQGQGYLFGRAVSAGETAKFFSCSKTKSRYASTA